MATSTRPRRQGMPSARISNKNNSEAPSAAHQSVLAGGNIFTLACTLLCSRLPSPAKPVLELISRITTLTKTLPETVRVAVEEDDILRVMTEVMSDSADETFVRRFDLVFGTSTRDANGHFTKILRGSLGMDCVLNYLTSISWKTTDIQLGVAEIKLSQVVEELERLWCVAMIYVMFFNY